MVELLFSHTEVIRSAESISCQLPAVLQLQCIFIAEYFPLTAQCFDSSQNFVAPQCYLISVLMQYLAEFSWLFVVFSVSLNPASKSQLWQFD